MDHFRMNGNITASADLAGCGRVTVYGWKESDPDFAAAFAEAEREATERLEHMAWERARGYESVDETEEYVRGEDGEILKGKDGKPLITTVKRVLKREYSPTLLIFLLKARAPDKYRERMDLTHASPDGSPLEIIVKRG